MIGAIGRWFKAFFNAIGISIDKNREANDAFNEATVEKGIREAMEKAQAAHIGNTKIQVQIMSLKDQIRREEISSREMDAMVNLCIQKNDETNGAMYAEQQASLEQEIATNREQLKISEDLYQQNIDIIAAMGKEIQNRKREFEQLKARVKISRAMEKLAELVESSTTQMQGLGGETSQAMERMREAANAGQARVKAATDLAAKMGAPIKAQAEMRRARGLEIFQQKKAAMNQNIKKEDTVLPAKEVKEAEKTPIAIG